MHEGLGVQGTEHSPTQEGHSMSARQRLGWRKRILPWEEPTPLPVLAAEGARPTRFFQTCADRAPSRLEGISLQHYYKTAP